MLQNRHDPKIDILSKLSFDKRPAEELYELKNDPDQIKNLAAAKEFHEIKEKLQKELFAYLKKTKDPRVTGGVVLWDEYPFYRKSKNNWQKGTQK